MHQQPDRVPTNLECVGFVMDNLLKHNGFSDREQVYQKFDIDIRSVEAIYTGPELKIVKENGHEIKDNFLKFKTKSHWTGRDYNEITCFYPFDTMETVEEINNFRWPHLRIAFNTFFYSIRSSDRT